MQIRDRVKEFRRVKASELRPNPQNWRTHGEAQRNALRGVLSEIGYADALIARECEDGSLMLLDGHLRAETTPDTFVPVLVVDLNEAEGKKLLATLDPLAAMAEANGAQLQALLEDVQTSSDDLKKMLADLAANIPEQLAAFKDVDVPQEPPRMTWVLIGIPTEQFGKIAPAVESIAAVNSVLMETTSNEKYVAAAGQRGSGSEASAPAALPG